MYKHYKAIESESLSKPFSKRFVVVDTKTGEVVDDSQGWGFKSAKAAYACWRFKCKSREKNAEKIENGKK